MQKNILKIAAFILVVVAMTACEASSNYSQLLKQEQAEIDNYLAREGYELLEEFPSDSVFGENQIYRFPNEGIYIRLIDKGAGDTLTRGDQFSLRYRQSSLEVGALVEEYWTTQDRPYPNIITMGDLLGSCIGWQNAFDVMRRNDSHAIIIVPSKLGRNIQEVEAMYYEMKIKVLPK